MESTPPRKDGTSETPAFIDSMVDLVTAPLRGGGGTGEAEKPIATSWWRCQSTVALLGFLGITVSYTTRVSLSIAIVAMVSRNITQENLSNSSDVCPLPEGSSDGLSQSVVGDFSWDSRTQGMILASFFYGSLSTTFISGRASEMYGGKIVFGLGILLTAVFTVLAPLCAYFSKEALMVNRFLQGMAQGMVFPAINTLMATWATPNERSKLTTQIYVGIQVGTIIGMSVGGWLCNLHLLGGWPLVFYLFGGLGILWGIPWFLLIHNRPELHPRISPEELRSLQQCQSSVKSAEVVSIPWKALIKSVPLWCILLIYLCNGYGFFNIFTTLPTYLSEVQHFDLKESGWISALPYLVMWVVSIVWGLSMNWLIVNEKITLRGVRVISTAVGTYGPAACMLIMCFVGCHYNLALVIICLAIGMNGASFTGFISSTQDIAPNLAGSLLGICNTLQTFSGGMAPLITGIVINNNPTMGAWKTVFIIPACLWTVASTVFIIFSSAEVQEWNEPSPKKKSVKNKRNQSEFEAVETTET